MNSFTASGGSFPEEYIPTNPSIGNIYRRYTILWFAIALFDTLATVPLEYRHIWKGDRTLMMFLFLMNRWGSLLLQAALMLMDFSFVSAELCGRIFWLNGLAGIWVAFFCSSILSIRVYAVWDKQRRILYLLLFMLTCLLGLLIGPTFQLRAAPPPPELVDLLDLPGCEAEAKGKLSSGQEVLFWASVLVFDAMILFLTLYRTVKVSKVAGRLPILKKLQNDGIWYYLVITATNLISVVFTIQTADLFLRPFQSPASLALTSLMATRLVLSLFNRTDPSKVTASNTSTPKSPFSFRSRRKTTDPTFILHESDHEKRTNVALQDLNGSHGVHGSDGDFTFASDTNERDSFGRGGNGGGVQVQRETFVERSS